MDFSPKATFVKGPSAQQWTDVASSQLFLAAESAAMLEMQSKGGYSKTQDQAAARQFQMEGAREFLSILMNLTTPPPETPKQTDSGNLIHSK